MRPIAKRRALVALGVALVGILIAVAAFAGSARGNHTAVRGAMTPAVGAHPKWAYIGSTAQPSVSVFGCQTRPITAAPASSCYGPDQIQRAYGIKSFLDNGQNGAGRTIVIIDAFGSPTITSDLALFDSAFGLPAPNFTRIDMPGLAAVRSVQRRPGGLVGRDVARRRMGACRRPGREHRARGREVGQRLGHPRCDAVRPRPQPRRRRLSELRRGRSSAWIQHWSRVSTRSSTVSRPRESPSSPRPVTTAQGSPPVTVQAGCSSLPARPRAIPT